MGWHLQIKDAFEVSVKGRRYLSSYTTDHDMLIEMEQESEIPYGILKRWLDAFDGKDIAPEINLPQFCSSCKKNPPTIAYRENRKGNVSKRSKYYGYCKQCISRKQAKESRTLDHNHLRSSSIGAICPRCAHEFYVLRNINKRKTDVETKVWHKKRNEYQEKK